jgi:hypothetical protein
MNRQAGSVLLGMMLVAVSASGQNTYPWPSSGNVGIGTTNPQSQLSISAGTNSANTLELGTTGTWSYIQGFNRSSNTAYAPLQLDGSLISLMYGPVGIGTTNPGESLEIGNSGNLRVTGDNFGINVDSSGAWSYNNWLYKVGWNSALGDWAYFAPSGNHPATNDAAMILDGKVLFGTGKATADGLTNEWMRITGGNVGIGTTNPASLLSVGASSQFQVNASGAVTSGSIISSGPVGIGVSPQYTLDVAGQIHASQPIYASGGITFGDGSSLSSANTLCGGDYAESVDVSDDRTKYGPGDVMIADPGHDGRFLKSAEPYSTGVLGVYSTKPGAVGRRQSTPKSPTEIPMAMIGIVPTKVSAENGTIKPGDLLVTSATPGYAMKGTDRGLLAGAVVGKSLGHLDAGKGMIEVAVTLQ